MWYVYSAIKIKQHDEAGRDYAKWNKLEGEDKYQTLTYLWDIEKPAKDSNKDKL